MASKKPDEGDNASKVTNFLQYLAIGSEVFAIVVGPLMLGYWFDLEFGTRPKGLLAGFFIMIVLVVQFLRQLIQRLNK